MGWPEEATMDQKGPPAPQKIPTPPKGRKNDRRISQLERWSLKSAQRIPRSILDHAQASWMFPRVSP